MQKHICSLQISRICGAHTSLSIEHLSALYTALSLHYEHGMNAFGINMLPTDIGPSDQYALLAVYVMYDLAVKLQSSEKLIEALCLLHYLLCNSPSNFHAKLLCLQIYHILGCGWGAYKTYESLEVKHIQLDSMGYLHCALMPSLGITSVAKHLYDSTLKFFTTSYKDSVEYLAMSYKFGSFSKLEEFMTFRDNLANSLHYAMMSVEALMIEIVSFCWSQSQNLQAFKNMCITFDEERIKWDELTDNRDISVVVKWDPNNLPDQDTIGDEEYYDVKTIFKHDIDLLRIRSMILRLLGSLVDFITSYELNDIDYELKSIKMLKLLQTQWNDLYTLIESKNIKRTSSKYLVNLLPSRLHTIISMPYQLIFNNIINLVINLFETSQSSQSSSTSIEKIKEQFVNELNTLTKNLITIIDKHNKSDDIIWGRKDVQEHIINTIEIHSLCSFILLVCYDRSASMINQQQNKKTKRKGGVDQSTVIVNSSNMDKQRYNVILDVIKVLKQNFLAIDVALGKFRGLNL